MSKIYDGPGKAIKQCSCGAYIHAKVQVCPACEKDIPKKSVEEKNCVSCLEKVDKEKPLSYNRGEPASKLIKFTGKLIYAPAGEPYIPYSDNVEEWCSKIFDLGLKQDKTFSGEALYYWYQFYDDSKDARKRVYEWSEREGFGKMQKSSNELDSYSTTED